MRELWNYLNERFEEVERPLKAIRKANDLAAYEARHGDSLYRSRTALRQRQWRGVGLKAILAGVIFAGAALVRQQYGDSLDTMEALPVAAGGLALVILVLAFAVRRR